MPGSVDLGYAFGLAPAYAVAYFARSCLVFVRMKGETP